MMAPGLPTMPPPQLPSATAFGHLQHVSTRMLQAQDFAAWMRLRDEVLQALPHPDCYVREEDEHAFFTSHCGEGGQTIGVFHGDALIAYSMVGFPGAQDADNLGASVGMATAQRAQVAHIASCMVLPQWRGNGLQRTLLAVRLAMAQAHGRPIALAMVSPRNHRSRHNLMRQGMHVGWTGNIGGLERHVLRINLHSGTHFDMGDERIVDCNDFTALCEAAAAGYVGVGELRGQRAGCAGGDGVHLRFVRVLHHGGVPR